MIDRIVRAIRLDWTVFREIAEDKNAMSQAAIIVVVVTFLSALGGAGGLLIARVSAGTAFLGFLVDWLVNGVLIGWIGWSILTYFVGAILFKGKSDIPEMLRVLGYASAPKLLGVLTVFRFIPCVGWVFALAGLAGWVLALIAGIIAIREAQEVELGQAIITVVVSWVIAMVIALIITGILGIGAAATPGLLG
jgi:hypothetical protein